MITRRDLLTVATAGVAFSAANIAQQATAQQLPRTAHILSGFTPGLQDALARLVAGQMKDYAETIVVETRPGAGGRVAVEAVKTADADGSVMLLAPLGFMMFFPHVYKSLRYQPQDFTPVSTIASTPTLLTIGSKVPGEVKTLTDFVAWCRANPKQATYGTPGAGTTLHFLGAMLGRTAGFDYLHVPYQGNGAIQDLLKGEIASAILPVGSSLGLVQSGDIRALATTGPRRSPFVPAVPTVREAGYPSLEDLTWYGFFVPAKTPANIVEKLNTAIQAALRTDEVKSGMEKLAVEPDAIAMGDFSRLITSESDRWKAIVQATGFVPTD
ncbi:tripartite tricarboxylate transporter substrate-binding protein [Bradyrhizobium sp. WYCCWR 12699]|uniref:Bug family tripartite tricarboxylate transporter substrate binding protein n=1 Tax=Bradyrhizobium sp. WYCCWR 12699 TaxID=3064203 RepID=UPI0028A4F6AB|nr:tripartite tricarboxylate transporter substrate-binding protein [Bradyrhizobium sp. WYCCWR 12699]MDT4740308.1 tripartite tricarboxylate transporter substrate-binding protein [Bradyrhizobium sp. WYCCWR 12699]